MTTVLAIAIASLGGCSLTPRYERPGIALHSLSTTPEQDQEALTHLSLLTKEEAELLDGLDRSGQLKQLAVRALLHNRDYQIAMLRVEQARAEYGIARADRLPTVQGTGQMERQDFSDRSLNEVYGQRYSTATVGFNDFELDFFERVKALSESARHQFFATQLGQQASRKALIAEVAQACLMLRAEADRQQRAEMLLQRRKQQVELAQREAEAGGLSQEELQASMATLSQAQQHVLDTVQQLAKARNALGLLTGYTSPLNTISQTPDTGSTEQAEAAWLTNLDSERLLGRFDVQAAEEQLKAANASIGAARAAFFPSIRLSTGAGVASKHLHGLFSDSTGTWLFVPQINIPLFDGGRNQANLDLAKVRKKISVAHYEKVIQHAFRDMVDGLAERDVLLQRIHSQSALNTLAQQQLEHRKAQASRGDASKADELRAQIQAAQAEQALAETRLALEMNLLSLYRVLHGADASALSS
ncbi:efflux transporter outer membrane subunit [Pseudomonas vanderleydeniana]|uniref:Efflux transporter outer membrane subunit n=1 Tax=Pseudomonas vanderleydeniana TaxID=2745495 RepID=A0A9E6PR24_9PSED|nr:efflux transporter outer membrane subunit [Pseudomonas vanderleydeniana]QXI30902.1 efflux transporter outer membrane subunit [Pseudomonas vanderleydeniana]